MKRGAKAILLFMSLSVPLLPCVAQEPSEPAAFHLDLDSTLTHGFDFPNDVRPTTASVNWNLLPEAAPPVLPTVLVPDNPHNSTFLLSPNSCISPSEIGLVSTCLTLPRAQFALTGTHPNRLTY